VQDDVSCNSDFRRGVPVSQDCRGPRPRRRRNVKIADSLESLEKTPYLPADGPRLAVGDPPVFCGNDSRGAGTIPCGRGRDRLSLKSARTRGGVGPAPRIDPLDLMKRVGEFGPGSIGRRGLDIGRRLYRERVLRITESRGSRVASGSRELLGEIRLL